MMCDLLNKTTLVPMLLSPRQFVVDASCEDAVRGAKRALVIDLQFIVLRIIAGDDEQRM